MKAPEWMIDTVAKATTEWYEYLAKVNQLGTPIDKLDSVYWDKLDEMISDVVCQKLLDNMVK